MSIQKTVYPLVHLILHTRHDLLRVKLFKCKAYCT